MEDKQYKSDSIFKKRIRKFKTIKRAYYSLIILIIAYAFSLSASLFVNSTALVVKYTNNIYDPGEEFVDLNNNKIWDLGEDHVDQAYYYYPLFKKIFKKSEYEASFFGQNYIKGKKRYGKPHYRLLKKEFNNVNDGNFVIMPLYPYDPFEEVLSERDEEFTDLNNNGFWDEGEPLIDENNNGIHDQYRPATSPDNYHIMGTDNQGRDVLSRIIYGFNISITFAIIVWALSYLLGIIIGASFGFFGGKLDLYGLRFVEMYASIPFLFTLMMLASFIRPTMFVLATMLVVLSGWIGISYYIRGEFLREKSKDYVSAAIAMGQSNWNVMFKHILPNALTPIITNAPFAIMGYIGSLVSLDYLGFGLQPPTPSWGELINQAAGNLQNWHLVVFPLLIMAITLFLITLIGEGVRAAFDPKVHSRLR